MPALLGALVALRAGVAWPDTSGTVGALGWQDQQGFHQTEYRLDLRHDGDASGQYLVGRWHEYRQDGYYRGVLPFRGAEPAAELGGHLLRGLWWAGAAVGFQGTPDWTHATGQVVLARAFPLGLGAITPRLLVARAPVAMVPIPLSLGLMTSRGEAVVAWRSQTWTGELGGRVDLWDSVTVPGRVQNPAFDTVPVNRIASLHGYGVTTSERWINIGFSSRVEWAQRSTLVQTQLYPWDHSWYPVEAPPFRWETAILVRAAGRPVDSLSLTFQAKLPALSQDTRAWGDVRRTSWGSAPFEARLEVAWSPSSSTTVRMVGLVFAKPWEGWDVFGPGAYRQGSVLLSVQQRF